MAKKSKAGKTENNEEKSGVLTGEAEVKHPYWRDFLIGLYIGLLIFVTVVFCLSSNKFPFVCNVIEGSISNITLSFFIFLAFVIVFTFLYLQCWFVQKSRFLQKIHYKSVKILCNFLVAIFIYLVSLFGLSSLLFFVTLIYDISLCPSYSYNACSGLLKPIIYLYPTEATDVSVKLGAPEKLSHTYPKYVEGWTVRAEPNGNLTDTATGRHYYALYWEGKQANLPQYDDGFVVAKNEIASFLEEKLALLGLNEREANEFIIYWLPKLESAPYSFIHFVSQEEQNQYMPLEVKPVADTVIRVLMAFKSLDKPIDVKEQALSPAPARNGFTVIEWGGTEIGSYNVH